MSLRGYNITSSICLVTEECWEWLPPSRMSSGYGAFVITVSPGVKRQVGAHRFAYELGVGPIPAGMLVCHHCDNPPCCNPSHLFVGTYADNNRDKTEKGRNPGNRSRNGHKQFAIRGDDLITAMAMVMAGQTQRAVAQHFNVSPGAVCRALAAGRLDARNADLARERVGMFLTVEHLTTEVPA